MSAPDRSEGHLACGVVAIGRNEGERLKRCLASALGAARVVYVDSGSTDGSVAYAKSLGVEVVELDLSAGFTAARARNAGFRRLRALAPELALVQFVDGDCELAAGWLGTAMAFLAETPQAAAVFGRRRERHPERSIYNRICDAEWDTPLGEARACGGDVMMRTEALEAAGGYRDDFIAGEEPELCVRLRAAGWTIWRIAGEMTEHDAAMTHFRQWWRRSMRSGYAYGLGRHIHGSSPERMWVWETNRGVLWAIVMPAITILATYLFGIIGLIGLAIYLFQLLRRTLHRSDSLVTNAKLAAFELLSRFAETAGLIRYLYDRIANRRSRLIEYK